MAETTDEAGSMAEAVTEDMSQEMVDLEEVESEEEAENGSQVQAGGKTPACKYPCIRCKKNVSKVGSDATPASCGYT